MSAHDTRIIVSSDIGGSDPDDYQSLVHLLSYADHFAIEGLISSPPYAGRAQHILETLDAYEQDYDSALKAYEGYPAPSYLRSVTRQGAIDVAPPQGFSAATEGSRWIVECARAKKAGPLYVLAWGSLTDVAQAVHDAPDIKGTIRVYSIGSWNTRQDPHARDYLYHNHQDLWWIESDTTFRGMYVGGEQSEEYGNTSFVSAHIKGHGALGDFYDSKLSSIKMGDTPSVLYLLNGDPSDPAGESWGGSYAQDSSRPRYWTDRSDMAEGEYGGAQTVNRWRRSYLDDWELRMDRLREVIDS